VTAPRRLALDDIPQHREKPELSMTSVMIIHDIDLLRGALAAVLSKEPDLEVHPGPPYTGETATQLAVARAVRPDVAVVHLDRCDATDLILPRRLRADVPGCEVLIVTPQYSPEAVRRVVDAGIRGFLSADAQPAALVDAVRRLAAGERVVDPQLLMAALREGEADNPLSARQRDVLRLAGEGLSSQEIGQRLFLSPGTVRNYLSAAIRQTGGRGLLEALEKSRREGWL
jgi:two-component system response regulator DesR